MSDHTNTQLSEAQHRRAATQKVGTLRLYDRADGVKGHYCIGRLRRDGANEFWHTDKFCSAGEVFIGKEAAETKLRELFSATPATPADELHDALDWTVMFFENIDSAGCSRKECERAREVAAIIRSRASVAGPQGDAPLFEAKLLGFGEGDRITLCEPCLRQAIANHLVSFSCALPAHSSPVSPSLVAEQPIDFSCRVCGIRCDTAPDPPARAVCPEHCEDHDYRHDRSRAGKFCIHCDQQQPEDWDDD